MYEKESIAENEGNSIDESSFWIHLFTDESSESWKCRGKSVYDDIRFNRGLCRDGLLH